MNRVTLTRSQRLLHEHLARTPKVLSFATAEKLKRNLFDNRDRGEEVAGRMAGKILGLGGDQLKDKGLMRECLNSFRMIENRTFIKERRLCLGCTVTLNGNGGSLKIISSVTFVGKISLRGIKGQYSPNQLTRKD